MFQQTKCLVTGGTGLIGTPLVRQLLDSGAKVTVASLDSPALCPEDAEFLRMDLTDPNNCNTAVAGQHYVFHLAGIKGAATAGHAKAGSWFTTILLMNTNIMEACRHSNSLDRVLYTSTVGVYPPTDLCCEDQDIWAAPPHEVDKYAGWAKRMGELQLECYNKQFNWDRFVIVRPTAVYGPGDNFDPKTAMLIPAMIARMHAGGTVTIRGDGYSLRDFLFCNDAARGMFCAMESGWQGHTYNLGSGKTATVGEAITLVHKHFPDTAVEWIPSEQTGQRVRVLDSSKAKQHLDFEAEVELADGIERTVRWYKHLGGPSELRHDALGEE